MDTWCNCMKKNGPNSYIVRVPGNRRRFVHADHLIHSDSEMFDFEKVVSVSKEAAPEPVVPPAVPPVDTDVPLEQIVPSNMPDEGEENGGMDTKAEQSTSAVDVPVRRSRRTINPPNRYG